MGLFKYTLDAIRTHDLPLRSCITPYFQGFSDVTTIYQNLSLFIAVHELETNFILTIYHNWYLFIRIFVTFSQLECNFLLYICPLNAALKGAGRGQKHKQPPSFWAIEKFHNFWIFKMSYIDFITNICKDFATTALINFLSR